MDDCLLGYPNAVSGVSEDFMAKQHPINEPEVGGTELAYVTAINKSDNTFFSQLCKYFGSINISSISSFVG